MTSVKHLTRRDGLQRRADKAEGREDRQREEKEGARRREGEEQRGDDRDEKTGQKCPILAEVMKMNANAARDRLITRGTLSLPTDAASRT